MPDLDLLNQLKGGYKMTKLKNNGTENITLFVNIEHGTKHVQVKPGEVAEVSQEEAARARQIYEGNVVEVQEEIHTQPEAVQETKKEIEQEIKEDPANETPKETAKKK